MKSFIVSILALSISTGIYADCLKKRSFALTGEDMGNLTSLVEQSSVWSDRAIPDIMHQGDDREVRTKSSPQKLAALGRLNKSCTVNLVASDVEENSKVVTTAAHCLKQGGPLEIIFFTNSGVEIKRSATVYHKGEGDNDTAVLILNKEINNTDITPLVVTEYLDDEHFSVTVGGYSSDKEKGQGGKVLTYDSDCKLDQESTFPNKNYIHFSDCSTYAGSSGGALIYTERDSDYGDTNFIVGHHMGGDKKGNSIAYKFSDDYESSQNNHYGQTINAIDEFNSYND